VYIEVGKNKEGFWDNDRFVEQMCTAVLIFEELYPGAEAVFMLDWSGGHTKKPEDGLNAHAMNVKAGGKQPHIRDTVWNGKVQAIGQRGLRAILQERGLLTTDMKQDEMVRVLSECSDFKAQATIVEELVATYGRWKHRVVMVPKFHCELNPPELKFAIAKGRARKRCTGKMQTFKRVFKEELENVSVQEMRRCFRKCREWAAAYRALGDSEKDPGFQARMNEAVKKYKSHRRVFDANLRALQALRPADN
jgi:hypothetical protein